MKTQNKTFCFFKNNLKTIGIILVLFFCVGIFSSLAKWPDAPQAGKSNGGWLGSVFNLEKSGSGELVVSTSLDVKDWVRPGWDWLACTSEIEGTIRYNKTSKELEVCDGVTWKVGSGGGTPAPTYSDCTLDGVTVSHGSSRTFYSRTSSPSCSNYDYRRTCTDGVLSGSSSFKYKSCSAPATYSNCTLDGVTVSHGSSRTFYSANNPAGATYLCSSFAQTRTCNNGILSGSSSHKYSQCNSGCKLDNVYLANGAWRGFYLYPRFTSAAESCEDYMQWRICSNGTLSGSNSYKYAECNNSCTINNVTISHGWKANFYAAKKHTNCREISQMRTCNDWVLSGNDLFQYGDCTNY